jgi:hypothetical protein
MTKQFPVTLIRENIISKLEKCLNFRLCLALSLCVCVCVCVCVKRNQRFHFASHLSHTCSLRGTDSAQLKFKVEEIFYTFLRSDIYIADFRYLDVIELLPSTEIHSNEE